MIHHLNDTLQANGAPSPPLVQNGVHACDPLISAIRDKLVLIHEPQRGIADHETAIAATLTAGRTMREEWLP
jgi:hypothetical protein